MNSASVMSASRHLFQFISGLLVAKGLIDGETAELVIGAGSSIAVLIWLYMQPPARKEV